MFALFLAGVYALLFFVVVPFILREYWVLPEKDRRAEYFPEFETLVS